MKITRRSEAIPYSPPRHTLMDAMRMQGLDASPLKGFWVGHSTLHAGGNADQDKGRVDKVYVVLSGAVVIVQEGVEHRLEPLDSVFIPAGESRSLHNGHEGTSTMLVIIGQGVAAASGAAT